MPTSYYRNIPNNTHPQWWKDPGLRKNMLHCFGTAFSTFYMGYDQNLLSGLQAVPSWNAYFPLNATKLGLVSASLFLPAIFSAFFADYVANKYGRRPAVWFAAVLIFIGSLIMGLSNGIGMFVAARVICGIGGGFGKTASPALLQELAHPRLRAILGCLFYPTYFWGSITAAWLCYAGLYVPGNAGWRFPSFVQMLGPVLVVAMTCTAPESPRWLIANGREKEGLAILVKYHANGDENDPLVQTTYREIIYSLEQEALMPKTRYMDFIKTSGNRRRLIVAITLALATNWVGNGIISYYLTPVLKTVGFSKPNQILGITAGLAMWNLVISYSVGINIEKTGRRPIFFISIIGMLVSYCLVAAFSARFAATGSHAMGIAVLPFLYIYYGFYDMGFVPLPYGYTTEILPYHMRTKGLAIFVAAQNAGNAFNQFVNPVALKALSWKYYLVYIGILAVYLVFAYFMYPETKHRTMEEVAVIFDYGRKEGRQKALELMAQHQAQQEMQEGGENAKIDVDHEENP